MKTAEASGAGQYEVVSVVPGGTMGGGGEPSSGALAVLWATTEGAGQ